LTIQTELEALVGTELGVSPWWRLDQRTVDVFSRITGDSDPIHNDPDWASRGPYGGTIAHGFLILSMLGRFSKEVGLPGSTTERHVALNYGLDKVRFIRPVAVGTEIRARIRLISIIPRGGDQLVIKSGNEIECRSQDGVFMYAELLTALVPIAPPPEESGP